MVETSCSAIRRDGTSCPPKNDLKFIVHKNVAMPAPLKSSIHERGGWQDAMKKGKGKDMIGKKGTRILGRVIAHSMVGCHPHPSFENGRMLGLCRFTGHAEMPKQLKHAKSLHRNAMARYRSISYTHSFPTALQASLFTLRLCSDPFFFFC